MRKHLCHMQYLGFCIPVFVGLWRKDCLEYVTGWFFCVGRSGVVAYTEPGNLVGSSVICWLQYAG
jgi:hypothetical protein